MSKQPCVYILASRRHGTIYVGVTSDLLARLHQHRNGVTKGFASEHRVYRLVHFEQFDDMYAAISRGKATEGLEAGLEDRAGGGG